MLFNAARQSFAFSAITSGVLSILFATRYFIAPYPIENPFTGGMPLAAMLTLFSVDHSEWSVAIAILLLAWILFITIQLTMRYASPTGRNYIPIQFFVTAACGIIIPVEALASYVATLLLILSTRQFISSFRKDYRFEEAFRAGFYLGFIPLLYAPAALLIVLIPIVMSLYRRSLRELIVCAVGAMLPIAGAGFIYWALGESAGFIYREIWRCAIGNPGLQYPQQIPIIATVGAGMIILLVLIAVVWFLSHRKGMRTRQRKVMGHVSCMLIILFASIALPGSSTTIIPLLAVPIAMAVPYAFSGKQAAISSVIYSIIIITFLTLNLLPIFGISVY